LEKRREQQVLMGVREWEDFQQWERADWGERCRRKKNSNT
jgi:hypothetical protein